MRALIHYLDPHTASCRVDRTAAKSAPDVLVAREPEQVTCPDCRRLILEAEVDATVRTARPVE